MAIVHPLTLLELPSLVDCFSWAANLATLHADPAGARSGAAKEARKQLTKVAPSDFDVASFVESLVADSMRWRQTLNEMAGQCPAPALRVALADDCIQNPVIEESDLGIGVYGRRYNAALDLAGVPFSASDIQDYFAATSVGLAEEKITWGHQGLLFAGNFALGAAGGLVGVPGAGAAGRRGTEFFMNRIAEVDSTSLACAQILTAVRVMLAEDDCDNTFLTAAWHALVDELIALYSEAGPKRASGQSVSDLGRDMRVVEAAEKEVRALVDERHLRAHASRSRRSRAGTCSRLNTCLNCSATA